MVLYKFFLGTHYRVVFTRLEIEVYYCFQLMDWMIKLSFLMNMTKSRKKIVFYATNVYSIVNIKNHLHGLVLCTSVDSWIVFNA